jgi:hypothetical protein
MIELRRDLRREIRTSAGALVVTLRLSREGEAMLELRGKGRHTGSLFNFSMLGARLLREARFALSVAALLAVGQPSRAAS